LAITKISGLMLITAVRSDNYMKSLTTKHSYWLAKQAVHIVTTKI
jgi:hypothetical protein